MILLFKHTSSVLRYISSAKHTIKATIIMVQLPRLLLFLCETDGKIHTVLFIPHCHHAA